jgi:hypothetical protein
MDRNTDRIILKYLSKYVIILRIDLGTYRKFPSAGI